MSAAPVLSAMSIARGLRLTLLRCIAIVAGIAFSLLPSSPLLAGDPVRLTRDGAFKQNLAWSPDGRTLLFTAHHGKKTWLMQWTDAEIPAKRLSKESAVEMCPSWSPDGKRFVHVMFKFAGTQGNMEIVSAAADGSDVRLVTGDQDGKLSHEEFPAWSPDGKKIVFVSSSDGNQDLYLCDPNGANRVRLTQDTAIDTHPVWSADGKQVVFATSRWGDMEIAAVNVDGTNLRRLTNSRGVDDYPACSPDSRHIAFTSHRDGNFEVYVMATDGSGQVNVTRHSEIDNFPAWTPDGRLSFVSNRDHKFDVYLLNDIDSASRRPAALVGPSP